MPQTINEMRSEIVRIVGRLCAVAVMTALKSGDPGLQFDRTQHV